MTNKNEPKTEYTKIENKEGIYRAGDPKCVWCDYNKELYRNEKFGTYCCVYCKENK